MLRPSTGRMLVLAGAVAVAGPAFAQFSATTPLNPAQRNQLLLRGAIPQVQALDRIEQRRQMQELQQLNREADRMQPQQPLDLRVVPDLGGTCMKRVFGNKFVRSPCK